MAKVIGITAPTASQSRQGSFSGSGLETEASKRRTKKSRASVACSSCHAKKQRCGSESGPSKHYIQALEKRLLETESVLFTTISILTHNQPFLPLFQHTENYANCFSNSAIDQFYQFHRGNKFGIEYWTEFGLESEAKIARWFQDHGGVLQQPVSNNHQRSQNTTLGRDCGGDYVSNSIEHDAVESNQMIDIVGITPVRVACSRSQSPETALDANSRDFSYNRNPQVEKATGRSSLYAVVDPGLQDHPAALDVGTSSISMVAPESQNARLTDEEFLW
ncbi:hypothetical protein BP5796_08210 [Coleophoma crateriformis]|uniref:Zn(2)-C6 fungal-type domain-containing protein n=1 Tax=Coleophoma crateriformis TaxID=565419 RepID=A0A3D8RE10_9HELO|nr:hypothetical protein BP5796_08210 [Coleophoma crateriformis]